VNTSSTINTVHPSGASTTRPPDPAPDNETPEQLGARLGLKDFEGKIDIEAARKTHQSQAEAKKAREEFDKRQAEQPNAKDGPKDSRAVQGDDGNTSGESNENLVGPGSPHPDAETREDIGSGGSSHSDRYDGGARSAVEPKRDGPGHRDTERDTPRRDAPGGDRDTPRRDSPDRSGPSRNDPAKPSGQPKPGGSGGGSGHSGPSRSGGR